MMRYTCRVADTTKVLIILYFANKQNAHVTRTTCGRGPRRARASRPNKTSVKRQAQRNPTYTSNDGYV